MSSTGDGCRSAMAADTLTRNRHRALVGPDARAIDQVARLPTAVLQRVMVPGARRRAR